MEGTSEKSGRTRDYVRHPFVITDRTVHPEGIAWHKGVLYATSVSKRKIIKVTPDGKISDFVPSGHNGLASVLAIAIDEKKNILGAASSPLPQMENFDSTERSAIFKYELLSGKQLAKFELPADKQAVFGDLILTKKGEAYISDSQTNTIFRVNERSKMLEVYFTSDQIWSLQGITFSDDERYLFAADYIKGIFRIDTQTKELTLLENNVTTCDACAREVHAGEHVRYHLRLGTTYCSDCMGAAAPAVAA